ncbi:serine-rich coiled-coil domain-containing protein 2 isoform X2 [Pangasianodon hypophthalmus]|uniref:serine-rich coiled-coil domain-containing protein 2 isoform X2 n=1 Tax=Pangasianodon hypophthalmus TaxID=310915 RepID=UPI000EFECB59|nr:serine-rich coiled-coil domain-containing protein 2 isoform X2 [Pangasianodon hypophthalmus]
MEDTALKQTTMVSRLPKFGSRATPASGPLTNGSTHNVSSGWAKGVPVGKQNGIIRVPAPIPMKGRKGREDCGETVPDSGEEARVVLRSQQQPRSAGPVKQIRKPSAAPVGKTQRSIPTVPSTIPRTITQPIKTNPRNAAPKQPSPIQPLCSKVGANVVAPSQGSSSSPQGSLQSSLSHSSDSLKSLSVENVVRSQSFSYLKRPAAATNPPLTRSFSFNRATELAKELPRPLSQSPVARSPVTQTSMVLDRVAKPTIAACSISFIPPSTLKKSLLPNCTDGKPSSISYKLMRPSLIKQPRPFIPVKVQGKMEFTERGGDSREKATPISEPSSNTHSAGTTPEEPFSTKEANDSRVQSLEILEDMSLSSTSSLERNDVSEEYMDDFDDLGNGGGILLMPVHEGKNGQIGFFKENNTLVGQCQEGSSMTSLHSFVSETVDWAEIGLTGSREVADASHRCGTRALSTERDLPHGSSLELSPSDSSGGTYMWDEEVLEPIGGASQLCGSFDSNLNSMDILNNLDNLDSCDLEEDDLMLDVDLPEDVSLHSDVDVAARYDLSDSNYWPWRKQQQYRGNTEQLHYEERDGVLQPFDNGHTLCLSRRGSGQSSLDELMLKHMAQDCSSVREQLFHLRTLLQMEEDGSVDEAEQLVSSPSSEEPSSQQVDELLKEVQKLREELRGKDVLISKLTQQLSAPVEVTPCLCQQGELQRREHQDKSTQTPWRAQNDILPPPPPPPPPPLSPRRMQQGTGRVCVPLHYHRRVEELVHYFTDTACLRYYSLPSPRPASTTNWQDHHSKPSQRPPVTMWMPSLVMVQ